MDSQSIGYIPLLSTSEVPSAIVNALLSKLNEMDLGVDLRANCPVTKIAVYATPIATDRTDSISFPPSLHNNAQRIVVIGLRPSEDQTRLTSIEEHPLVMFYHEGYKYDEPAKFYNNELNKKSEAHITELLTVNKQTTMQEDSQKYAIHSRDQKTVPSILEPVYVKDVADGSYWTIIRIPTGLSPRLETEQPEFIQIILINSPPSEQELERFPEQLQRSIGSTYSTTITTHSRERRLEIRVDPPTVTERWMIKKVYRIRAHENSPPHHIVVHWVVLKRQITYLS